MEKSFDFGALMQKHQQQHKNKPTQFASVAGGVRKRLESNLKCRKSSRLVIFDSIRNLPRCDSPKRLLDPLTKEEHRRILLEKWKEEKALKKKREAAQKKKPFIAGVAHAPLNFVPPPPPPKAVPSTSGRVTRSQTAKNNTTKSKPVKSLPKQDKSKSFAPVNALFKAPEMKNMGKIPILVPQFNVKKTDEKPKLSVSKKKGTDKTINHTDCRSRQKPVNDPSLNSNHVANKLSSVSQMSKSKSKSFIKLNKSPIPKSESNSEQKLRSPKSPVDVPLTPEQIVEEAKKNSPFVTHSRGKCNARRELKEKINDGLLDEDASDINSVGHFRRQLNSEIKRMTELCDTWEKISEQIVLPETVQEAVLGAVGQARLLMSHKLQQFAALVARCERPEPGQGLVTPADLHGFWDMVFMQVENVDMRFKKLEEMRARNWVEETPVAPRRKIVPKTKPVNKPTAASRLRDVIAAARKAKKQETQANEPRDVQVDSQAQPAKTFEAGFFCVRSPVRSPATPTRSSKSSLLKTVLSSEAKKSTAKNLASLAMLRASLIGKSVETDSPSNEEIVPITPINLHATPGRSILKSMNIASATKSGKKSIKVVLFDDSDVEAPHDNTQKDSEGVWNEANGVDKLKDVHIDQKVSPTVIEKGKDQKENKSKKKSLVRQDATEDSSLMMTRSRRKSMSTPSSINTDDNDVKTQKRSSRRKKALEEVEVNIIEEKNETPKRSSRRKNVLQDAVA